MATSSVRRTSRIASGNKLSGWRNWSADLESLEARCCLCASRDPRQIDTSPSTGKKTPGETGHTDTDHTNEPHNHPSQPSRPTTAHKHDRATTDEPGADRTSVGTHASPQTRNHRTPLTLKRQGGAGSQVPVRRLGGAGTHTQFKQERVLESPIAYLTCRKFFAGRSNFQRHQSIRTPKMRTPWPLSDSARALGSRRAERQLSGTPSNLSGTHFLRGNLQGNLTNCLVCPAPPGVFDPEHIASAFAFPSAQSAETERIASAFAFPSAQNLSNDEQCQ